MCWKQFDEDMANSVIRGFHRQYGHLPSSAPVPVRRQTDDSPRLMYVLFSSDASAPDCRAVEGIFSSHTLALQAQAELQSGKKRKHRFEVEVYMTDHLGSLGSP